MTVIIMIVVTRGQIVPMMPIMPGMVGKPLIDQASPYSDSYLTQYPTIPKLNFHDLKADKPARLKKLLVQTVQKKKIYIYFHP